MVSTFATIIGIAAGYITGRHFSHSTDRLVQQLHAESAKQWAEAMMVPEFRHLGALKTPVVENADPSMDILIRDALGSLLNGRGIVDRERLFKELYRKVPASEYAAIPSSLNRMKDQGAIGWSGDDVTKASTIRVLPQRS